MNKQLLKTSGADVLSSRRKLRKTLGGWHPPPPPPLVPRLRLRVKVEYLIHRNKYFFNAKKKNPQGKYQENNK